MDSRKRIDKRSTDGHEQQGQDPSQHPYGSNRAHFNESMDLGDARNRIVTNRKPYKKYRDYPDPDTHKHNDNGKLRQNDNVDNEISSRKRCFSPEVYALGRQVILTKRSTVDVSFLPEKKLCLEEFGMRQRQRRIHDKHTSDNNARWKQDLRLLLPPPPQLALTNYHNIPRISRALRSEPRFSPFSVCKIFLKDSQRPGLLSTFFSADSFPWEKWSQSNFCVDTFRKILLSGQDLVAVSVIETEDQVFIKFVSSTDVRKELSPLHQPHRNLLFEALKAPITLPFHVIGGIINWIFKD